MKLKEIYFGIFLRIKLICLKTISFCEKEMAKLIQKDSELKQFDRDK